MYGIRPDLERTAEDNALARHADDMLRWTCGQGRHPMLVQGKCPACDQFDLED